MTTETTKEVNTEYESNDMKEMLSEMIERMKSLDEKIEVLIDELDYVKRYVRYR